ncbi:MAG TPA: GAF domain-containing protein [Blastocatellia bacterium]|nr:GAF domain-containing protein [Blastocatellia bacterium]
MTVDDDAIRRCLEKLRAVTFCHYAQWVVEDPASHDYRVVAAILPANESGYDVAHRTGVIGQVFRIAKPILVPDAQNHPLYDPFDHTIEWELAFPVFDGGQMIAVINLEGSGSLDAGDEHWRRVCQAVEETTWCAPPPPPQASDPCLIETVPMLIQTINGDDQRAGIVGMARTLARAGRSTLLVGHYPDLLRGRGPTMVEASRQGLDASYCYFGVERRLDLLATGPATQDELLQSRGNWWDTCNGRYAFVLVTSPRNEG